MPNKTNSTDSILNSLTRDLGKNKNIKSVIQIGSSLWDTDSKDIDLILVTKGGIPSYDDLKFLSNVRKYFSRKFGVEFGKGGVLENMKALNFDLILIPEDYKLFYSFNPLLVYGMSLNPYKVLYGYDFFKKVKGKLKPENDMLFKFGGSLSNFYFFFVSNFDNLVPKNSKFVLSMFKIILYPLVFMKGKHVKKKEIISFLKFEYPFFGKLCKKYYITEDIFYRQTLSEKEIEKIYDFIYEMSENIFHKFYNYR